MRSRSCTASAIDGSKTRNRRVFGLGRVEREVGVAHQLGPRAPVCRIGRDADAGADEQLLPGDGERRVQCLADPRGKLLARVRLVRRRRQDGELIAAAAGDVVGGRDRFVQPLRDGDQQLVADIVAERVIDPLEPVQIQAQQSEWRCRGAAGLEQMVGFFGEQHAVAEAGQVVVHRHVPDPAVRLVAGGHVGHDVDDTATRDEGAAGLDEQARLRRGFVAADGARGQAAAQRVRSVRLRPGRAGGTAWSEAAPGVAPAGRGVRAPGG